jgi:hypothetical protein
VGTVNVFARAMPLTGVVGGSGGRTLVMVALRWQLGQVTDPAMATVRT